MRKVIQQLEEENELLKKAFEELKLTKQLYEFHIKELENQIIHNSEEKSYLLDIINKYKKIIDILKRKKVNIFSIQLLTYEQYNKAVVKEDELTKEEYKLLKEVLNDEK